MKTRYQNILVPKQVDFLHQKTKSRQDHKTTSASCMANLKRKKKHKSYQRLVERYDPIKRLKIYKVTNTAIFNKGSFPQGERHA